MGTEATRAEGEEVSDDQPTTADQIREHLTTIIATWNHTADPMNAGHGTSDGAPLPSSTIVLRADITNLLAYWVHALVDEWPAVLQHLEPQHYPTTNPDAREVHGTRGLGLAKERTTSKATSLRSSARLRSRSKNTAYNENRL